MQECIELFKNKIKTKCTPFNIDSLLKNRNKDDNIHRKQAQKRNGLTNSQS